VSGYGLDNRAIDVRSPAEAKDFLSSLSVQTGSDAHPASCTMGTGGPFPGIKRGRGVTLTTHPHLVPRSRMSRSYTSSLPSASVACSGTDLGSLLQLKCYVTFSAYNKSLILNKKKWEHILLIENQFMPAPTLHERSTNIERTLV
jgi:hypothetical protein